MLILYHLDMECHIQIETNVLDYTIGRKLSLLTFETGPAGQMTYKSNNQSNPPFKIG